MHVKVLDVKDVGVTLGVLDKDLRLVPELRQVTFADIFNAIHSVHVHREGPFQAIEDILTAHENGTLHTYESHDEAVKQLTVRGDETTAERVRALTERDASLDYDREGAE